MPFFLTLPYCYNTPFLKHSSSTSAASTEQEIIIDNVPGRIVLNSLASGTGLFDLKGMSLF